MNDRSKYPPELTFRLVVAGLRAKFRLWARPYINKAARWGARRLGSLTEWLRAKAEKL